MTMGSSTPNSALELDLVRVLNTCGQPSCDS